MLWLNSCFTARGSSIFGIEMTEDLAKSNNYLFFNRITWIITSVSPRGPSPWASLGQLSLLMGIAKEFTGCGLRDAKPKGWCSSQVHFGSRIHHCANSVISTSFCFVSYLSLWAKLRFRSLNLKFIPSLPDEEHWESQKPALFVTFLVIQ